MLHLVKKFERCEGLDMFDMHKFRMSGCRVRLGAPTAL